VATEWYEAGTTAQLDQVERGRLLAVDVVGISLAIARMEDGSIYAIEDRCPHMRFPLSKGFAARGTLTCGWHHWEFDLKSDQRYLNPQSRCTTYPVKTEVGKILVQINLDDLPPAPGGFPRPGIDEGADDNWDRYSDS